MTRSRWEVELCCGVGMKGSERRRYASDMLALSAVSEVVLMNAPETSYRRCGVGVSYGVRRVVVIGPKPAHVDSYMTGSFSERLWN